MQDKNLQGAITAYGFTTRAEIVPVKSGLINSTFFVSETDREIVLQKINRNVFKQPENIVSNYNAVFTSLKISAELSMPDPLNTVSGEPFFTDADGECWRATAFVSSSVTHTLPETPPQAGQAASCYGKFTMALSGFDVSRLKEIIPRFHDLGYRYDSFMSAITSDLKKRKNSILLEISKLENRKSLVNIYAEIKSDPAYRLRVMHHDAKISNILFHEITKEPICPVDFDTMQPGYFFSDIGDMIRSMACSHHEDSTDFDQITIRPEYYKAIFNAYLDALSSDLSGKEIKNIHYAGLIMINMQALRYLADFLNGDTYYQVSYPGQNLDRSRNQLALLKQLEQFLKTEYGFIND